MDNIRLVISPLPLLGRSFFIQIAQNNKIQKKICLKKNPGALEHNLNYRERVAEGL